MVGWIRETAARAARSAASVASATMFAILATGFSDARAEGSPVLSVAAGHLQPVNSIAWSADGTQLLTGSPDNTARLWHLPSGALLRVLAGPTQRVRGVRNIVTAVALAAPTTALVAGSDGARTWDLLRSVPASTLEAPSEYVSAIAVAPDGATAAVAGHGPAASGARPYLRRRHLPRDGSEPLPMDGMHSVQALAWSAAGNLLAVAGAEVEREVPGGVQTRGTIRLFHEAKQVAAHSGGPTVDWAALSPDGAEVYAAAGGEVTRWQVDSWKPLKQFPGSVAALSRDGVSIATDGGKPSGWEGSHAIVIRDAHTGRETTRLGWPEAERERVSVRVSSLAFDPEGRRLAAGFGNGKVAVWDLKDGKLLRVWHPSPAGAFATELINREATRLAVADGASVSTWDLKTGRSRYLLEQASSEVTVVAASPSGDLVAYGTDNGELFLFDGATGRLRQRAFVDNARLTALSFGHDGRELLVGGMSGRVQTVSVADLNDSRPIAKRLYMPRAIAPTPDGTLVAVGDETGEVRILGAKGENPTTLESPAINATVLGAAFDGTGHKLAVAYGNGYNRAVVFDLDRGTRRATLEHQGFVVAVRFSPDGKVMATAAWDQTTRLWDSDTLEHLRTFASPGPVAAVSFAAQGRLVAAYAGEGVQFWRVADGAKVVELVKSPARRWSVVAPDGRFDTDDIDAMDGLHWLMPGDLGNPLRPELLVRDYFEPRLLARLLACETDREACTVSSRPVTAITDLNRFQPEIALKLVDGAASSDEVTVEARVQTTSGDQTGDARAAFDLRLFRDGQLIHQWPAIGAKQDTDDGLDAWRRSRRVVAEPEGNEFVRTFRIALPRSSPDQTARLTAYAFNSDRVRSAAATLELQRAGDRVRVRPRAFLVMIGVSAHKNRDRDLSFAAKDARDLFATLRRLPRYDVIPVLLTSEHAGTAKPGAAAVDRARKDDIRAVLALLAGIGLGSRDVLRNRLGAQVDRLGPARPDDLVLVAFSGHGHVDERGRFYLMPSDSGPDLRVGGESLPSLISSDELAAWLRPIDAGEMAVIIDACHAAGSVPDGFKPGPLGDRGLGQLAYDKGMRILAATQAADAAIESERLGQGLLTFALVHDALGGKYTLPARGTRSNKRASDRARLAADSDHNGRVTLDEWMLYAEARVPGIYRDLASGRLRLRDPLALDDVRNRPSYAQTPALFDFSRNRLLEVVISQ